MTFDTADRVAIDHHHAPALRTVRDADGIGRIAREVDHPARTDGTQTCGYRVVGVQHREAGARHVLHDDALQDREILDRGDVIETQMITRADIGDDRHLAAVKGQTFAENAAARGFKHCGVDVGMHQDAARAARTAAITAVNLNPVDINTVGQGHAHA